MTFRNCSYAFLLANFSNSSIIYIRNWCLWVLHLRKYCQYHMIHILLFYMLHMESDMHFMYLLGNLSYEKDLYRTRFDVFWYDEQQYIWVKFHLERPFRFVINIVCDTTSELILQFPSLCCILVEYMLRQLVADVWGSALWQWFLALWEGQHCSSRWYSPGVLRHFQFSIKR